MSKDIRLNFYGSVTSEGQIKLPRKRFKEEVLSAFLGSSIEVIVKRKRKRRSTPQNAYYWGVMIPYVLRGFIDAGNNLQESNKEHHELIHTFLKDKFLHNGIEIVNAQGEVHTTPPSTQRCTTTEFMEYMDQVKMWSAEFLNTNIPDPEEQLNFFAP